MWSRFAEFLDSNSIRSICWQFQVALRRAKNMTFHVMTFMLSLIALFCHFLYVPGAADHVISNMDQQLLLIRRSQQVQQRKIHIIDLKLNQVISRLVYIAHHNRPDSLQELTGNMLKALDNWQKQSNIMQEQMNEFQLSFQWKNELSKSVEELQTMMMLALATRTEEDLKSNDTLQQLVELKASNISDQANVEYVQAAKADCSELDEKQRVDGIYKFLEPEINERNRNLNERYCVFTAVGAAWTMIQHRKDPNNPYSENFNRSWDEYRAGFGNLENDFWFGNEFIHRLVYRDDYELRVELEDQNGIQAWAEYGIFRLESESYNYQLVIGKLNGNSSTSDALSYHNHMDFWADDWHDDCVGWWFDRCQEAKSNLNGQRIIWGNWHNEYQVKASRMLIRPLKSNSQNTDDIYDDESTNRF